MAHYEFVDPLNLLEPIAKPIFRWSHNDASAKGQRELKQLLE